MSDHYVAPNLLRSQLPTRLKLDNKIDLYERRINGWFLDIAMSLKRNPSDPQGGPGADFASLMIVMSLFEAHGVLLQGKHVPLKTITDKKTGKKTKEPRSPDNFQYGLSEFLSVNYPKWPVAKRNDIAEAIYTQVRCGLYHVGMIKTKIELDRGPDEAHPTPAIAPRSYRGKIAKITFNVPALVVQVREYFAQYLTEVRNPKSPKRKSFAEGWAIVKQQLQRTP